MKGRRKPVAALIVLLLAATVLTGCVSRGKYKRDVGKLVAELNARRRNYELTTRDLDAKLKDKSATLKKLTERYAALQNEREAALTRINKLRGDLEQLSKDVAELKMILTTHLDNVNREALNEMLIKVIDMEYKLGKILQKEEAISSEEE